MVITRRRGIRLLLPITLIVIGLAELSGCIYIPLFNPTIQGKNVAGKVGESGSKRPIRVGWASRNDAYRLLGQPQYESKDGRQIGYEWRVLNGVYVGPLCFITKKGTRTLLLNFDASGRLRSFELGGGDPGFLDEGPPEFPPFAPAPVNDQRQPDTRPLIGGDSSPAG